MRWQSAVPVYACRESRVNKMPCPICGEYYFSEEEDQKYVGELDILACEDCREKVEQHHKIDGKYVVDKCKECGHVKQVYFIKYKKRGRKTGSKNKPKEEKNIKTLGDYV